LNFVAIKVEQPLAGITRRRSNLRVAAADAASQSIDLRA